MSEKKALLTEQEVKRFAKLSGVEVTPELLKERAPESLVPNPFYVGAPAIDAGGDADAYAAEAALEAIPTEDYDIIEVDPGAESEYQDQASPTSDAQMAAWAAEDKADAATVTDRGRQITFAPSQQLALGSREPDAVIDGRPIFFRRSSQRAQPATTGRRRGGRRGGLYARGLTALAKTGIKGVTDYDTFYAELDKAGLTRLLGQYGRGGGKDKKWGGKHEAALAALQAQKHGPWGQHPDPQNPTIGPRGYPMGDYAGTDIVTTGPGLSFGTPEDPHDPSPLSLTHTDVERMVAGKHPKEAIKAGIKGHYIGGQGWVPDDSRIRDLIQQQRNQAGIPSRSRPAGATQDPFERSKREFEAMSPSEQENHMINNRLGRPENGRPVVTESKDFSSQEEKLIQTLTERILTKYFKK